MAATVANTHKEGRYFMQRCATGLQWPHGLAVKEGALYYSFTMVIKSYLPKKESSNLLQEERHGNIEDCFQEENW